tara:strand:- start:425 stop:874 length:450 start_codon:yes stop_codon:yes gene_type:complete
MGLFKALSASILLGVFLPFFYFDFLGYAGQRISMSLSYMLLAGYCYKYIVIEVKLKNRVNILLISLLCICMVISSWFNFLFVSHDIYYMLIEAKQGDGLSWKNIYRAVELVCLLTVGYNGIINLRSWLICRCKRFNVIITNNSALNAGR